MLIVNNTVAPSLLEFNSIHWKKNILGNGKFPNASFIPSQPNDEWKIQRKNNILSRLIKLSGVIQLKINYYLTTWDDDIEIDTIECCFIFTIPHMTKIIIKLRLWTGRIKRTAGKMLWDKNNKFYEAHAVLSSHIT